MDWQTISLIVGIISALWTLIFGQKPLLDLLKKPKGVPTQMNSLAIITLLALILLVSSATLYVLLAFRSPSAPPSSPAEPKTQTVNQQLLCMSNCDKTAIQIKVVSFTPYPTQNKTNMVLELNSQHDYSGCYFSDVRSSTAGLDVRDPAGKTYEAGGELDAGGSFSLVAQQPQQLTAIYSFLPTPGATYTLQSSQITCTEDNFSPIIYGDARFTF